MNNFQIHIIGKDEDFKISDEKIENLFSENQNLKDKVSFIKHKNNKLSLPAIYNQILTNVRNDKTTFPPVDMIAFMHADVDLDLKSFISHLEEVENKYDALGLVGCKKISVSQKPLNWFCGSRPYPESRFGCVSHGELNNQISFFNSHSPTITDTSVSCIDGLCIILNKKIIFDNMFNFDEKFEFSHYDTDFSFNCVMNFRYRLGVIVEKTLQHWSVGKSILTEEFLEKEKIFREKWKI